MPLVNLYHQDRLFFIRESVSPLMILPANGDQTVITNMSSRSVAEHIQCPNVLKDLTKPSNKAVENWLKKATMPVMLTRMAPWLEWYPDKAKSDLILYGFKMGFHVPAFSGEGCLWVANLESVATHPDIVKNKILSELEAGRISGPFDFPPFKNVKLSQLGLVPKKELNSYRLIHNFPIKNSLNYWTDKSDASVSYASFDDA